MGLQAFDSKRYKRRPKGDILFPVKVLVKDGVTLDTAEIHEVTKADSRAAELRQSAPRSERLLWNLIEPMGFMHSVPLFGFVADFYHPTAHICIEVDGFVHRGRIWKDINRDRALSSKGIKTFRFKASEVYHDPGSVAMHVKNILTLATPIG